MYTYDNIFDIYHNIGRRLPFQVKRCKLGMVSLNREKTMYSQKGRTFIVERIRPSGKYGKAYGKCLVDGIPNDEYSEQYDSEIMDGEIPCARCGGWVLIDVPGVDMDKLFPYRPPKFVMKFGKYKGKTIREIYKQDPKYIFWLLDKDYYFRVDFDKLLNIPPNFPNRQSIIENEINRVFPKTKADDLITFGKYYGKSFREVFMEDPNYIEWFLRNNRTLELDLDSFVAMIKQNNADSNG
ncbi:MAG: hypothetical protein J6C78_03285 [Muribaculaceae bacterium]|nr:hypothetical protein [Muribaculaceae bacterium]